MKLRSPCDEPGCLEVGSSHPVNDAWVSPKLRPFGHHAARYSLKHRKGKGTRFMDEATAIRRYGKDWRLKATETPP